MQMQLGDLQRLVGEVDARDPRARARHRLGEDAAAAADVEHVLPFERRVLLDPAQAQRVDLVQRPELALRVPPAVGQVTEFAQLGGVCVFHPKEILEIKSPAEAGLFRVAARYFFVPMTSISTRRFFWRPSFDLLLATGCFSPLPSV